MSILVAVLISLSTCNAQVIMEGNKPFVSFSLEYATPVDVDYQATIEVTYHTPSGTQSIGYVIMTPAGSTSPGMNMHPIHRTWTMVTWELISSGPYVQ